MTIAILILILVNTAAIAYLASVIFEIRDKMNNVYPELIEIFNEQRNIIHGILDSMNRWSDLCADIISHIERVEDMEGDIKDIFEWIHSVDDNVADMRKDIQLIQDLVTNTTLFTSTRKIEKDICEIKEKLSPENYSWDDCNWVEVEGVKYNDADGDTDGDISVVRYPSIQADLVELTKGEDDA